METGEGKPPSTVTVKAATFDSEHEFFEALNLFIMWTTALGLGSAVCLRPCWRTTTSRYPPGQRRSGRERKARRRDEEAAFPMLPLHPDVWPFFLFRFYAGPEDTEMSLFANIFGDFGAAGMPGTILCGRRREHGEERAGAHPPHARLRRRLRAHRALTSAVSPLSREGSRGGLEKLPTDHE